MRKIEAVTGPGALRRFLTALGPGLITGAADDDPSGIGTYSIAGALFGYSCLWIAWFTFPLMAAVQLICARLGMVSGRGLGDLLRKYYGPRILWPACSLLVIANVVNIGADLGAMASSTSMVAGLPAVYLTPLYTLLILALMVWASYRVVARIFKWMTLVLFAYVITAFLAHPAGREVAAATLLPRLEWSKQYWSTIVAVLGTTISPFLFFWQASQEVEEEREQGKVTVAQRRGATEQEKRDSRTDVFTGMLFSNLIMYFVILTAAATLHVHGKTSIGTVQDAAEALRPLAGNGAYLLFTLGVIGTGMLSVPVLAGSTAYAIAEGAKWCGSLTFRPRQAPQFYVVLAGALLAGLSLNWFGFGAVALLFWSAVVNGILAPPLIVLVVLLSKDSKVMGRHVCGPVLQGLGWLTAAIMSFAAVAMWIVG